MADWSSLPRDALFLISNQLENGADYVRFRSICTSWRSTAPKRPQFPWLTVEYTVVEESKKALGLYEFPKPHFLKPQLPDGITKDKYICGCSRGWICVLDSSPTISLNNPFTGAQIRLPPFTSFPKSPDCFRIAKSPDGGFLVNGEKQDFDFLGTYLVRKVVLSADPVASPKDCVVMGLMCFGKRLIFLLPGSDRWTISPRLPKDVDPFEDLVFYKGSFYAVSRLRVFLCDPRNRGKFTEIRPALGPLSDGRNPRSAQIITHSHLVESSGVLYLVTTTQISRERFFYDYTCQVYQVDMGGGRLRLLKTKNLGGRSLFLDDNSESISASSFPGCESDQIYLIQLSSNLDGRPFQSGSVLRFERNIVVLNIENGNSSIISTLSDDTQGNWWTANWLTPSL